MRSVQETLDWHRTELENSDAKLIKSIHIPGFSGFRRNGINLLGSRAGMGTTNLLLSIAIEMANRSEHTLFITTHHSELEVYRRLKSLIATKSEVEGVLNKYLHIYEIEPHQVSNPKFAITSLLTTQKLNNIIIDTCSIEVNEIRELLNNYELTIIMSRLLGKSVELNSDYRPRYKDFTVKKINPKLADIVVALFTPEVYCIVRDEENNSTDGVTEFIILKSPFESTNKRYKIS